MPVSRTSSCAPERPPLVKPVETDLSGAADQGGSLYVATAHARPRGVAATIIDARQAPACPPRATVIGGHDHRFCFGTSCKSREGTVLDGCFRLAAEAVGSRASTDIRSLRHTLGLDRRRARFVRGNVIAYPLLEPEIPCVPANLNRSPRLFTFCALQRTRTNRPANTGSLVSGFAAIRGCSAVAPSRAYCGVGLILRLVPEVSAHPTAIPVLAQFA